MRLIFGELKDNHNSSRLLYIGLTLVAGMMTEEWLTADIMLEEQLCRYRYRGVHN